MAKRLTELNHHEAGRVKLRPLTRYQSMGVDDRGRIHLVTQDHSDHVERYCQAERKRTRGKIRRACSADLTWHKVASIPRVWCNVYGDRLKDPAFLKWFLSEHPEFRVYKEGSSRSKLVLGIPGAQKGGVDG